MTLCSRRALIGCTAASLWVPSWAPAAARHYAVLSLIGNQLEVVQPQMGVGSNIDRNRRHVLDGGGGLFDRFASAAVERAVRRADPSARVTLLAMPPSSLHDQPERLFDGKQVGLPGAAIQAVEQGRMSHVILLTKHRGDMKAPVVGSTVGMGKVRGVGYYVDTHTRLVAVDSGQRGAGFLAPFVSIRATLADAQSGDIQRDELVEGAENYSNAVRDSNSNPWDIFSAEDKVKVLRRLLEHELERVIPLLVSGQ